MEAIKQMNEVLTRKPYPIEAKNTLEFIKGQAVSIVYVDSYSIMGQYIPGKSRIELSKYLVNFPTLHAFVLKHERQHVGASLLQNLC